MNHRISDRQAQAEFGVFLCAGHGAQLGGERPLWGRSSQPPTTSQSQGCPS